MAVEISESSKKIYTSYLKKLAKINIYDFDKAIEDLQKIVKINTRKSNISAIMWKLKCEDAVKNKDLIDLYSREVKNLRVKKEYIEEKNIPGENEKYRDWNVIIADREKLLSENKKVLFKETNAMILRHFKNLLLISLYTYFPPRRVLDYAKMKYITSEVEDNKQYNFYVADKKIFIFNRYKTDSTYGKQVFSVPDKLVEIIEQYIDLKSRIPLQHIIEFKDGVKLKDKIRESFPNPIKDGDLLLEYNNETQLSKELENEFGYRVNTFRHSFVTFIAKDENLSLEKRRDIAEKMGHGVIEQLKYQRIVD